MSQQMFWGLEEDVIGVRNEDWKVTELLVGL
jgi:hypothetical protein